MIKKNNNIGLNKDVSRKIFLYITLLRPTQMVKNLFVFIPMIFGMKLLDFYTFIQTVLVFISFSFVSSAIYILNDFFDRKNDRVHPEKRKRPIADNKVSLKICLFLFLFLIIIGLWLSYIQNIFVFYLIISYVVLNILYSLILKHLAIIDIMCVAFGFIIRLYVGSFATHISLSRWVLIMTFLLALFIAFGKRLDDLLHSDSNVRQSINGYNLQFVHAGMIILASVMLVAYIMYIFTCSAVSAIDSNYLFVTTIFVLLGVLRYLQLCFVFNKSGSPTTIFWTDRFLQITLLGWILSFVFILYL